tara:strand:+ start:150 stop:1955 length:1806 start_codon:yes stop_codon:yes gene_type:complete
VENLYSKKHLAAVVSFQEPLDKLRSCLKSLSSWVPEVIVVVRDNENSAKRIIEEFKMSICIHSVTSTSAQWECGLAQTNSSWVLLVNSNEIITGQLRKSIVEKTKVCLDNPCKFALSPTIIFLKKRLKYSLDWHDSQPSYLTYLSKNVSTIQTLKTNNFLFEGELIRHNEDTLADCTNAVINKANKRAEYLGKVLTKSNAYFLFVAGLISSMKIFTLNFFLRKGFKEGFEGIVFSVCDAHAELLGYLRYYEAYIKEGGGLRDNLSSLKKILVIKLRDIGDNILCTPLIHNLKYHLPETSISVLTWSYSQAVFENNPHIDQLFGLTKENPLKGIKKTLNQINFSNFDLVISTHSGSVASNLLSKIKTKYRVNNFYQGRNKSYNLITQESDYYRSAIERDLDCLRSLGLESFDIKTKLFLTDSEILAAKHTLIAKGLNHNKKKILVHPTAAVSIREWPLTKFNQLIIKLNQRKDIQIVVICTESEYSRVKTLLEDIPDLIIFYQITVRQMMAIIHQCDLVIDNDSSPSHIATALGIPTIVLFSQAILEIFRPYDYDNDQHFVFYNDVDCRECGLTYCSNRICLDFSVDEVFSKAIEMLPLSNH